MAEIFTMSEPVVGDGGVAPEKKMEQEQAEELSHRVVVGDGGGGLLEEKKKQELVQELSHRVVVGNGGGVIEEKKKKPEEEVSHRVFVQCPPQQKTNRRDLRAGAVPYKIRVIKEIMTCIYVVNLGLTTGFAFGAICYNKGNDGYLCLSMGFFLISTISVFSMNAVNCRTTALVFSVTTWILGCGFLAAVLTMNNGLSFHSQ